MLKTFISFAANSFFFTTAIFFLISVFFVKNHDWDIDAFLYIGSRLWYGELLYFYDFETKLPPLQYLFAIPSLLGGIGAWRILSALISIALGFWASHVLTKTLAYIDYSPIAFKQLRNLSYSFFLLLLYSLPGSESAHLEMVAASAAYTSLAFWMKALIKQSNKNISLILSGIFLAIAACIRPNYIYILTVSFIYIFVLNINIFFQKKSNKRRFFKVYLLDFVNLNIGFFVTLLMLLIPYFFIDGGTKVLTDGFNAIASYSDGLSAMKLFNAQLRRNTFAFYLGLYVACAMILIYFLLLKSYQRKFFIIYLFFPFFCIIAINISLLRNHYQTHNVLMFVPYTVPIFLLIFINIFKNNLVYKNQNIKIITKRICFSLCFIILLTPTLQGLRYGHQIIKSLGEFNLKINDRRIDYKLLNFLKEQKKSFLIIDSPIYHMLLKETRIGDGHPAMLRTVLSRKRLGPISKINLYTDEVFSNPCLSLTHSEKQIIIFHSKLGFGEVIIKCLSAKDSGYKKAPTRELEEYVIFIRL